MEKALGLVAFAFLLFIIGLAGKSRAVKKNQLKKAYFYHG